MGDHVRPADCPRRIRTPDHFDRNQHQIGALSRLIETQEAIYLFARWSDMESADWLYDNWPRRSEPALLAVNMRGLNVDADASYELVSYNRIEPWRISVLAAGESDWDNQKATFLGMGGKA